MRTPSANLLLSLLAPGLLVLMACSYLPEDHHFAHSADRLGQSVRGVGKAFGTWFGRSAHELATLQRRLVAVPRDVAETGATFAHRATSAASEVADGAASATTSLASAADRALASARDDVRLLTGPHTLGARFDSDLRGIGNSADRLPAILRIDRRSMAEVGDPERETSLRPASRSRSWLERVLDRMGLAP